MSLYPCPWGGYCPVLGVRSIWSKPDSKPLLPECEPTARVAPHSLIPEPDVPAGFLHAESKMILQNWSFFWVEQVGFDDIHCVLCCHVPGAALGSEDAPSASGQQMEGKRMECEVLMPLVLDVWV